MKEEGIMAYLYSPVAHPVSEKRRAGIMDNIQAYCLNTSFADELDPEG